MSKQMIEKIFREHSRCCNTPNYGLSTLESYTEDDKLRAEIIRLHHDMPVGGHGGQ